MSIVYGTFLFFQHGRPGLATTLHMAEGFALVMLCHCRLQTRKISMLILKEVGIYFYLKLCFHYSTVKSKLIQIPFPVYFPSYFTDSIRLSVSHKPGNPQKINLIFKSQREIERHVE